MIISHIARGFEKTYEIVKNPYELREYIIKFCHS